MYLNDLAKRLKLPEDLGDRPMDDTLEMILDAVMDRVEKVERALDEVHPGWTYGGHFQCQCASCSD